MYICKMFTCRRLELDLGPDRIRSADWLKIVAE